jgi:hypothetical protein
MSKTASKPRNEDEGKPATAVGKAISAINEGKPVREDFEDGGRLHIDRPLPFI